MNLNEYRRGRTDAQLKAQDIQELYGMPVKTSKIIPKNSAYFVDETTSARWHEVDKLFRRKWWSPLWWLKYWRTRRTMKREALMIVKHIGRVKS